MRATVSAMRLFKPARPKSQCRLIRPNATSARAGGAWERVGLGERNIVAANPKHIPRRHLRRHRGECSGLQRGQIATAMWCEQCARDHPSAPGCLLQDCGPPVKIRTGDNDYSLVD